ncbi:hypothetical protein ncot_01550 [Nocardioides sp. JQ2195]|uniref:hypothetical protein n=1 Tax=Nocardioides sp. JQ2195 TaxID=2592334 RepID=UPI00143E3ACB|nr:hypothetical protein [Nocardioides sp. JQ2195]QIX25419.1 hypothetical protein ncot_01550 [Nocardioides sp. JQ2195]
MNLAKRLGAAVSLVVLGVGLANVPASASAAPATVAPVTVAASDVAVQIVDPEGCARATANLPTAKQAVARAKAKVKAKRRALARAQRANRAKHTTRTKARVKEARRELRRAKRVLERRQAKLRRVKANKATYCAPVTEPGTPALSADQLGQLLALLTAAANGGSSLPLDPEQVTALLEGVIPGGAAALDPAMLADLLAGFGAGALDPSSLDPAVLLALLGSFGDFSPEQLASLLGETPDPAVFGALLQVFVEQFGGLAGGDLDLPEILDPALLTGLFTDVLGDLLGGLIPGIPGLPGLPGLPCIPLLTG